MMFYCSFSLEPLRLIHWLGISTEFDGDFWLFFEDRFGGSQGYFLAEFMGIEEINGNSWESMGISDVEMKGH